MRISDWSSDVCYSDLIAIACAHRVELLDPVGHAAGEDARRRGADFLRLGDHVGAIAFEAHLKGDGFAILVGDRYREAEADDQNSTCVRVAAGGAVPAPWLGQIGRASGRERGGKYGKSQGV